MTLEGNNERFWWFRGIILGKLNINRIITLYLFKLIHVGAYLYYSFSKTLAEGEIKI